LLDALELLSPNFTHPAVRRYAISRLQQAPDEEILLYLLQLVQALKYENFKTIEEGYARLASGYDPFILSEDASFNNCLEKKDSKDSNCTITAESVLLKSGGNQESVDLIASEIAAELESSVNQQVTLTLHSCITPTDGFFTVANVDLQ